MILSAANVTVIDHNTQYSHKLHTNGPDKHLLTVCGGHCGHTAVNQRSAGQINCCHSSSCVRHSAVCVCPLNKNEYCANSGDIMMIIMQHSLRVMQ